MRTARESLGVSQRLRGALACLCSLEHNFRRPNTAARAPSLSILSAVHTACKRSRSLAFTILSPARTPLLEHRRSKAVARTPSLSTVSAMHTALPLLGRHPFFLEGALVLRTLHSGSNITIAIRRNTGISDFGNFRDSEPRQRAPVFLLYSTCRSERTERCFLCVRSPDEKKKAPTDLQ